MDQKCISFICIIIIMLEAMSQPQEMYLNGASLLMANLESVNSDVSRYQTFVYEQNVQMIDESNSDPNKEYKLEANAFALLTEEEIRQMYLSLIPSSNASINLAKTLGSRRPIMKSSIMSTVAFDSAEQPEINAAESEAQVLEEVAEFLRSRKISKTAIEQEIIPQFRFQGNLAPENRRLLQANILTSTELLTNTNKTLNVDWSCISGRIRAQGNCGACYAFSTADNVGALMAIYYYTFYIELSIQEILDCTKNSLVYGCNGGFMEGALAQMMYPGIVTEYSYPYVSTNILTGDTIQCKNLTDQTGKFNIGDFQYIPKGDCTEIRNQLQKHPISVGIAGYKLAFYGSGIFNGCEEDDIMDHAVLLVGYKEDKGWRIKNSWGRRWGENGYAWLKYGNTCRMCESAFYPIPAFDKGYDAYINNKFERACPPP